MTLIGFRPLVLLLAAAAAPALACMNSYSGPPANFAAIRRSESVQRQIFEVNTNEDWALRAEQLRAELGRRGDYRTKNDLAVALSHAGKAAEAVTLLEEIEREKPGLYFTAANLGTAYELVGNNTKALEWIREGIKRNADSHHGTEWLHVRILEAKLALDQDPRWLLDHSVLGLPEGERLESLDIRGNRGEKLKLDRITDALIYQLHERVQFVSAPDAVVGSLLYDLGRLIGQESSGLGGAKDVFLMARTYLIGLPEMGPLRLSLERLILNATDAQEEGEVLRQSKILTYTAIGLWGLITVYLVQRFVARSTRPSSTDLEV